ncbi:MAG: methionyl-tRNA formyltransferase [Candidatus Magasanikbacteria bacterium]|nr:methionyl-tRNA formyltransferase [Candidatus Magasanikbacteria bacterium]
MNYLVVTVKSWNIENFKKFCSSDSQNHWFLIDHKDELSAERVREINPRYIFFPHWSWIIRRELHESYECVVFHMTDLPYGRGGSPLQNLIVRGLKETKVSALKVAEGMDTGDIYMKKSLSLAGSAEDIFRRASDLVFQDMIPEIVSQEPEPKPQKGEVVEFSRRKPEEGNMENLEDLEKIYDYIRMLDAEGYPSAFLETKAARFEFKAAKNQGDSVSAQVIIRKK